MDWDNVYDDIKAFAGKTAQRLEHTATRATLQVKLTRAEARLEDAYTTLGKIAYEHFTGDEDYSARVAAAISRINRAKISVLALQAEIARENGETPSPKKSEPVSEPAKPVSTPARREKRAPEDASQSASADFVDVTVEEE